MVWNNFQKVLEKRVKKGRILYDDKYFIERIVKEFILECFGKIGAKNILFYETKKDILFLKCNKSVWRSEVKLQESFLLEKINQKIGEKKFFQKIFFKK